MRKRHALTVFIFLVAAYICLSVSILNALWAHEPGQLDVFTHIHPATHCHCDIWGLQPLIGERFIKSQPTHKNGSCDSQKSSIPYTNVDIDMYDVVTEMKIGYPAYIWTHNGWIQQMDAEYDIHRWDSSPLTVHVVPFSHNDPGWLSTYDQYFRTSTKLTLDLALKHLSANNNLTFTWSEVIFIQRWYLGLDSRQQESFKKLLNDNRFEIVTGGWLMTDEAVVHYAAMLDQLIEGQLWLKEELNYTTRSAMGLDSFGHSPTLAYLLQQSGITSMLIQRAHYATKKHLAYRRQLEFMWHQAWGTGGHNDAIFCHLTPYMLYSISYSCGPDISVCCQFDFHHQKCWRRLSQPVTSDNVMQIANQLADQLRRKAEFFRHSHVLFLFGDDFRFVRNDEWLYQFGNLSRIFDFINANDNMRIKIHYSTLGQYFDAVKHELHQVDEQVPSLVGDFLLYSDRSDQYWSGFYSSRPILKSLARLLQSRLRSTELLYSLVLMNARQNGWLNNDEVRKMVEWYEDLVDVRQNLALMQHHDTITGTSRSVVVKDDLNTIKRSLEKSWHLIGHLISLAIYRSATQVDNFSVLEHQQTSDAMAMTSVVHNTSVPIVFFNPVGQHRTEVVKILVSFIDVVITNASGAAVPCQLSPVLDPVTLIVSNQFEVYFEISVSPLGTAVYYVKSSSHFMGCQHAHVDIFSRRHIHHLHSPFTMNWHAEKSPMSIANDRHVVNFCHCTHLIQSIISRPEMIPFKAQMEFTRYTTGKWLNPFSDKSGAYIFLPTGPSTELEYNNSVSVTVKGDLMSSVTSWMSPVASQTVTVYNTSGFQNAGIYIVNNISLGLLHNNSEIAMKLTTSVASGSELYTDVNGFQMHRRKTQSRLPIQGNFHPMTTSVYLQDDTARVTLLSAQSHGVASLESGSIEVILDRRLVQDDWRGLSEGLVDNPPAVSKFVLLFEPLSDKNRTESNQGHLSILAHHLSDDLNNAVVVLEGRRHSVPISNLQMQHSFPCDVRLVNLRSFHPLSSNLSALLILHRLHASREVQAVSHVACSSPSAAQVYIPELFNRLHIKFIEETTITGISKSKVVDLHSPLIIPPMEIKTWKVSF